MLILSIETSCDETAVSIINAHGVFPTAHYEVLGNALFSQIDIHKEYGGVFPTLAKREHIKTIIPMLKKALGEANLLEEKSSRSGLTFSDETKVKLQTLLSHETGLADELMSFLLAYDLPEIGLIAVTSGPGLEPALWVGVNFAKALCLLTGAPVVPTNHMEGHIFASVFDAVKDDELAPIVFPALSLLISGGHTELILMKDWTHFQKVGYTKDDAVGEAFDKVARMMGLPYPGGPEIGTRAKLARTKNLPFFKEKLPRPMLNSGDLLFSFSGIKTAVKYAIAGKELSEDEKNALARDFEDAVTEVLLKKTQTALTQFGAQTLIVGGGVSASNHIRDTFTSELLSSHPDIEVYFPQPKLATDNSLMIALAGHAHAEDARTAGAVALIKADGNRSL